VIAAGGKKSATGPEARPASIVPALIPSMYSRSAPRAPPPKIFTLIRPPLLELTMLANAIACACFLETAGSVGSACASFSSYTLPCPKAPDSTMHSRRTINPNFFIGIPPSLYDEALLRFSIYLARPSNCIYVLSSI